VPVDELVARRRRLLGPALSPLFYDRPLHLVRAEGVWMFDAAGRRYLDAYNNVPTVGHSHPRVADAVARWSRTLATNSRYLYDPLLELADRLTATMPEGLDTVFVVNSGTEANDLAWRLATTYTGRRGALLTEHAYHGMSSVTADLSPEEWPDDHRPGHVGRVSPLDLSSVTDAAGRLDRSGLPPAAFFLDAALTSDGILIPPPAEMRDALRRTHEAGALFVADEVQAGHGRTGEHLWCFQSFGIVPDLVVLGKPMGNGYPVAAVLTRSEIVERFATRGSFFSTYGGNPVAAAAALAVLDLIEDQGLIEHTATVSSRLRGLLEELRGRHPAIRDVRGRGLMIGVDLGDPDVARSVVNGMRDRGVLIGTTGRHDDVLKIRPPLVLRPEHADVIAEALDDSLESAAR
ncbi:MAG TPA: aminotransferase class III-fold pyridoxal phosphate-dependent enzyme, partial [Actinomycetota bacterium]|nr:aminotransferase class III-fold pyridoxal phosphate-dependent enzyme [Actinomycetota bacterium]